MTDDLDIFDAEQEVEQSRTSTPRLLPVVAALVGGGLLIGIVVSVIVAGLTSVQLSPAQPGSTVCDGAASCDNLTLDQVRSLTAIPFTDDATVTSSSYAETSTDITVRATVRLAEGSANPFDDSVYDVTSLSTLDTGDHIVIDDYAASGEEGSLTAQAALVLDDEAREVVVVEVVRTL